MNKQLIAERFGKARDTYNKEAIVQEQIAARMVCLLEQHIAPQCGRVVEVGCGTGIFSRMLLRSFNPSKLILNDICSDMESCLHDSISDRVSFCAGDAEQFPFSGSQNLIVSCSALQWFTSPERFFGHCHRYLSEDGYLAFSTFGKENMKEIAYVTGNSLLYRSKTELEQALSTDYRIVCSEEETVTLRFESPLEVLYHLKRTGVTAVKGESWTRKDLAAFCHKYKEQFNDNGSVCLTYHPIYIIVKKKSNEK